MLNKKIYIVATPIGNLSEFSNRAIESLKNSDLIITESYSRLKILFLKFSFKNKFITLKEKTNEIKLLNYLKTNNFTNITIISDAGYPIISDPGYKLIRELKKNYQIIVVNGSNAILPALIYSNFPPIPFVFLGFLKRGPFQQIKQIDLYMKNKITIIFYESPHRLIKTLLNLNKYYPNSLVCVCKEMTKKYEEIFNGKIHEIILILKSWSKIKGEYTLVIHN